MLLPDTSTLRSRAQRLDAEADELATRSRRVRTVATQVQWLSLAAARYRAQADGICDDLDGVAAALRRAAHELRAHADSVDRVVRTALAVPAEIARDGEQLVLGGANRVRSLLGLA